MKKLKLACVAAALAIVFPPAVHGQSLERELGVTYAVAQTDSGPMPLKMDMVRPGADCTTLRPTVIMIHGGGFVSGRRSTGVHRQFATEFLKRGWNAASISYALAGDGPRPSAPYRKFLTGMVLPEEDVDGQFRAAASAMEATVDAMDFFVENAESLCADPRKIILLGSSAGAGTAMRVAYTLDDAGIAAPKPLAVVDYWGGYRVDLDSIARRDPPLFIVHGTRDFTVPYSEAEALYARGLETNVPMQLHGFRGKGHGWGQINGDSRIGKSTVEDTMLFWLEKVTRGERPVTLQTMN